MAGQIVLNNGFIFGKTNVPSAKIILQALIGEAALGKIQLYDADGHPVRKVDGVANSDGYYAINFNWEPMDLGKMINTDFKARLSAVSSTATETTILQDGIETSLVVAVSLGGIQFSPLDGFSVTNTQAILDELLKAASFTMPAILSNQIRMSIEMYVVLGFKDIYL